MSAADSLRNQLRDLERILKPTLKRPQVPWSAEWMDTQSLLARQVELLHWLELEENPFEFELRLLGDEVRDSTMNAGSLGKVLAAFQEALYAIGDIMITGRSRVRGPYTGDVLEQVSLRISGIASGSFVIGMTGPSDRIAKLFLDDDASAEVDQPLPVFDDAIGRIFDVFDAAENEVDSDGLPEAISELGGHRALTKMIEVAKVLSASKIDTVAVNRSRFLPNPRECHLSAPGATRLRSVLSRTQLTTELVEMRGHLSGLRWPAGIFNLEVENGGSITGKVPLELREEIRDFFDSSVTILVEKTSLDTEVEGESKITYRLVELIKQKAGDL